MISKVVYAGVSNGIPSNLFKTATSMLLELLFIVILIINIILIKGIFRMWKLILIELWIKNLWVLK